MSWYVQHISVLIVLKALSTQRYTLIQRYVVANDSRFADNHTRTMVDGKVLANRSSWVYVDTRFAVRQLCNDTWDNGHLQLVQLMRYAVVRHRVHRWVAEYHLAKVWCRRVVIKHRLYVGIKQSLYLGQRINKLQRLLLGYSIHLRLGGVSLAVLAKLQSVSNLLGKQRCQLLHGHTYMVGTYRLVGLSFLKVIRKDDVLYQRHNTLHHLDRWQRC